MCYEISPWKTCNHLIDSHRLCQKRFDSHRFTLPHAWEYWIKCWYTSRCFMRLYRGMYILRKMSKHQLWFFSTAGIEYNFWIISINVSFLAAVLITYISDLLHQRSQWMYSCWKELWLLTSHLSDTRSNDFKL